MGTATPADWCTAAVDDSFKQRGEPIMVHGDGSAPYAAKLTGEVPTTCTGFVEGHLN
ncbi:MAG TPA: hypothetical protein VJ625_06885 [Propionibacteriaceae bacterium]|nr:hypothetical protein [Propionibacteriaceae bacterium]